MIKVLKISKRGQRGDVLKAEKEEREGTDSRYMAVIK